MRRSPEISGGLVAVALAGAAVVATAPVAEAQTFIVPCSGSNVPDNCASANTIPGCVN
jgi:hypothetical protein